MKKIYTLLVLALMAVVAFAQDAPNRLFIHEKSGSFKGFIVDRVDSISFATVSGRVAADVTFNKYETAETGDILWITVKRTADCQGFRISCLPTNTANMLKDDAAVASYLEMNGTQIYYDDFDNGKMEGFDKPFSDNTSYTILTVGYDKYGIACEASRAEFTTPRKPLVGNPTVTWNIDDIGQKDFTITFTPNSDVAGYAFCSFDKGTMEQQFEQFGPMFGFTNIGDMIKMFCGGEYSSKYTNKWSDMDPGKSYDVAVQCWDVDGTYADVIIIPVTTKSIGGEGVAEMTITNMGFGGDAVGGYWQAVKYTPNDQASLHRDMIITKAAYNSSEWNGDEGILAYLKKDQPGMAYWDFYGENNEQWNADPSTEYIAFSIAQNAKGEWGPLARLDITTPDSPNAQVAKKAPAVGVRKARTQGTTAAKAMPFFKKKQLTLTK